MPDRPQSLRSMFPRSPALASLLVLAASLAGQDAPAKPHPNAGTFYFPLQAGSHWTWRTTMTHDGATHTGERVAWDFGPVPAGAATCEQWLVSTDSTAQAFPEYWSADSKGVYEHACRYMGGMRGARDERTRLLPAPVGLETKWTWDYQLSYQTMGDVERDPERDKVSCVGELLAADTAVTVPAGEFRAAHVRITSRCDHWDRENVRELWFARGAGLVKEQRSSSQGTVLYELAAFHLASPAPPTDPRTALEKHLQNDPRRSAGEPVVQWIDREEIACYLPDAFAVVTFGEAEDSARAAFRVGERVQEIAADDLPLWSATWARMQVPPEMRATATRANRPPAGGREDHALVFLARVYGEIEARRRGLTAIEFTGSNSTRRLGAETSTECEVHLACKRSDGEAALFLAGIEARSGTLTKVHARLEKTEGVGGPRRR